jgi:hypothetical protein
LFFIFGLPLDCQEFYFPFNLANILSNKMLRMYKGLVKGRKKQGKFEPLKLEVIPCFSPLCFSKIIRTIQSLEKIIQNDQQL